MPRPPGDAQEPNADRGSSGIRPAQSRARAFGGASSRMRTRVARLGVGAVLAIALAGCADSGDSGESDQQSATEAWAEDVCSTVGAWTDTIADARTTLSDTANLSANAVRESFDSAAAATETFVKDLQGIGAPDTEAGEEAEQQLSTLSDELASQEAIIKDAMRQDAGTVSELRAQVSTVTGALSTMITDAQTALDNLRQLDGAAELEQAFQDAPECQDLQPSETPT